MLTNIIKGAGWLAKALLNIFVATAFEVITKTINKNLAKKKMKELINNKYGLIIEKFTFFYYEEENNQCLGTWNDEDVVMCFGYDAESDRLKIGVLPGDDESEIKPENQEAEPSVDSLILDICESLDINFENITKEEADLIDKELVRITLEDSYTDGITDLTYELNPGQKEFVTGKFFDKIDENHVKVFDFVIESRGEKIYNRYKLNEEESTDLDD
ncbi:MAG: hypothetical protein R6U67_06725 [Sodalinema sp.]